MLPRLHYWKLVQLFMFILSFISHIHSKELELTIYIDPGREECFFQPLKADDELEIDYQVVSGGQGELDINFHFYNPDGLILLTDDKTGENSHRHVITEDGDYKFCWDNYFSTFNPKTVFFSIYTHSEDDLQEIYRNADAEDEYKEMVNSIKTVLTKVHTDITRVRLIQEAFRANEARDRNIAERNYVRVNSWSISQVVAMVFVALCQVALIRGLIDTQSKFNKIWKYLYVAR